MTTIIYHRTPTLNNNNQRRKQNRIELTLRGASCEWCMLNVPDWGGFQILFKCDKPTACVLFGIYVYYGRKSYKYAYFWHGDSNVCYLECKGYWKSSQERVGVLTLEISVCWHIFYKNSLKVQSILMSKLVFKGLSIYIFLQGWRGGSLFCLRNVFHFNFLT